MELEISDVRVDERDAVVQLWHEVGLTRPWNDPLGDLDRALAGPSSTVLAARADGELVGTCMVGHDGHRAWVYYLATAPQRRGAGIGRALMSASEGWAKEQGMPKLQFMVRSDNTAVLDFYAHLGYEPQDVAVLGRRF